MARPTPKRTRNLKSPKQRAEETLATAERREKSYAAKVETARAELEALEALYRAAHRRAEHARANPDLHDEDDTELPFDGPDELTDEGET